jgi:hypothetical protein
MARPHKVVLGARPIGEPDANGYYQKFFWTQIGVAFVNKDGSLTLKLNYIPTDPSINIMIREPRERDSFVVPDIDWEPGTEG